MAITLVPTVCQARCEILSSHQLTLSLGNRVLNPTFSVSSRDLAGAAKLENHRCQTVYAKPVLPPSPTTHPRGMQEKGKSTRRSRAESVPLESAALLSAPPPPTPKAAHGLDASWALGRASPPWDEFLSPESFLSLSDINHSLSKCQSHTYSVSAPWLCPASGWEACTEARPGPSSFLPLKTLLLCASGFKGREGES